MRRRGYRGRVIVVQVFKIKSDENEFLEISRVNYMIQMLRTNLIIQNKIIEDLMNRNFLRPFFDLQDAFFPFRRMMRPAYRVRFVQNPVERVQYQEPEKNDPHALFDQFFKENQLKSEVEKEFFQKHYPETNEEKFDPFKVLEINKDATLEEAKDAYRKLAIKYHPKNDSSPQASTKFANIGKAYETILENEKAKAEDNLGFKSFFHDFDKEVESIFYPKTKETKPEESAKQAEKVKGQDDLGVLYSESSHYQSLNGKQIKSVAQRYYKKDGKLLKMTREENLKKDGNMQITETIDNGEQIKKKTFTQEKDTKRIAN